MRGLASTMSAEFERVGKFFHLGSEFIDNVADGEGRHLESDAYAGVAQVSVVGRQVGISDESSRGRSEEVGEGGTRVSGVGMIGEREAKSVEDADGDVAIRRGK